MFAGRACRLCRRSLRLSGGRATEGGEGLDSGDDVDPDDGYLWSDSMDVRGGSTTVSAKS